MSRRRTNAPGGGGIVRTAAPNINGMGALMRNKQRMEASLSPAEVAEKVRRRIAAAASTKSARRTPITLAPVNLGGDK
jgi:hypothetical protein